MSKQVPPLVIAPMKDVGHLGLIMPTYRRARKTLGFLPIGAFEEAVRKEELLVAFTSGKAVAGCFSGSELCILHLREI